MITIGQIAEMAGVSKSTVSRVLNCSGYVREDTRKKIEAIMEEYHYSPSASAQNLSRRETNTIGVIVPELDNTFFTEVLAGVAEVIDEKNFTMIVCNTSNNGEKEKAALAMMEQQRVRGVIFTPAIGYSDRAAEKSIRMQLRNLNVPVVLVDREIQNVQWDGVFYENFQSGYLATEHLICLGNKEIGIITGDMALKHARERYKGYVQAMEDYGLPVNESYIYEGDYTVQKAYEITHCIFETDIQKRPEALVLSNNQTTLGYVKGISEFGKELDQEIKVVGIDHIPVLDTIGYRYNCVTRDTRAMGRAAIELLLERLENSGRQKEIRIVPCIQRFYD